MPIADYPDPDIIRVTNDFYMVSTTFADSPGINGLNSTNLASGIWTPVTNPAPQIVGTNYQLVLPTANAIQFFQLTK